MSNKFTYRNKSKKILAVTLAILVVFTCGAVLLSVFAPSNEGTHLDFSIGGLNDVGKYEETDASLYTKEGIEIEGDFRVKLDFDSTIEYEVFFYDEHDQFLETIGVFETGTTVNVPEDAVYYRVEITPIWEAGLKADERVIGIFEVNKYAKQLKIVVIEAEADTEAEA